jgi:hypothetical protein
MPLTSAKARLEPVSQAGHQGILSPDMACCSSRAARQSFASGHPPTDSQASNLRGTAHIQLWSRQPLLVAVNEPAQNPIAPGETRLFFPRSSSPGKSQSYKGDISLCARKALCLTGAATNISRFNVDRARLSECSPLAIGPAGERARRCNNGTPS